MMHSTENLLSRLRSETADLHTAVESSTGLPGSVHSLADYRLLLCRLERFHHGVEMIFSDPRWAEKWGEVGVDPQRHTRTHLLQDDLQALRAHPPTPALPLDGITDFPRALGCLYVAEGSSLGGRVIGPAIRSAIGDVPTNFFDSAGRGHPSPWRTVCQALQKYGEYGDCGAVIQGARATFRAFERQMASPLVNPM